MISPPSYLILFDFYTTPCTVHDIFSISWIMLLVHCLLLLRLTEKLPLKHDNSKSIKEINKNQTEKRKRDRENVKEKFIKERKERWKMKIKMKDGKRKYREREREREEETGKDELKVRHKHMRKISE